MYRNVLTRTEFAGEFGQGIVYSGGENELLIRRSQVRVLPGVPIKSNTYSKYGLLFLPRDLDLSPFFWEARFVFISEPIHVN